jgi:acetyltransferase-like isoleucine patch superfamily enzyme
MSKWSNTIRKYYVEWELIGNVSPGILIMNFIFQRIFLINFKADIPVHFTSRIGFYENIRFVKDKTTVTSFAVSGGCYIQAYNGIIIGKNLLFAPGVKIISSNHDLKDHDKPTKNDPIIIGDNVWIGANAVILPGVKIGNNCVIGAGAVVTKSFEEDNLVIAGNPARIIKKLDDLKCIEKEGGF